MRIQGDAGRATGGSRLRVTLVHNPGAGDEEHSAESLRATLAEAGHDVRYVSSADGWEAALAEPADLVAVAGGDGTVCDAALALAGGDVPLTLLPLGSANNIARTLGLDGRDPAALARAWSSAPRRPLDLGELRAGDGAPARFVESAGGGVFADLLLRDRALEADPDGEEKRRHGRRLLREAVAEAQPRRWGLRLDGRDLSGDYLAVEAMNIREIGPNVALAPGADPGDGALDLVLVGPEHGDLRAPPVHRGRRLALRFPDGCPLHVDDEPWAPPGAGEAEIVAVPAALTVVRP
jgi:diacylglycerol kinase family enzyme